MWTWIPVGPANTYGEPEPLKRTLRGFGTTEQLGRAGTKRPAVLAALKDVAPATVDWDAHDALSVDGLVRDDSIGVCLELGRAHTNKGGLHAVLRAAIDPLVSSLILVAPSVYKGGKAAAPMAAEIREIVGSRGIMLDLVGVAVIAY